MDSLSPLGIIAGGGDLPQSLVDSCNGIGRQVFVAGIAGSGASVVGATGTTEMGIGELGHAVTFFKTYDVEDICFAGHVSRPNFKTLKVDAMGAKLLPKVLTAATRGDDALLRVVLKSFEKQGFNIIGADEACANILLPSGVLAGKHPNQTLMKDVVKGVTIASAMGALDIGQGCIVRKGLVMAVEAQEGTDRMLARAQNLHAENGVLVKWPKPVQDRRVDLPTIGPSTVEGAARAGLSGIAAEAGATLVMKQDQVVQLANQLGIFIIGLDPHTTTQ